jgi:hypothetical protein
MLEFQQGLFNFQRQTLCMVTGRLVSGTPPLRRTSKTLQTQQIFMAGKLLARSIMTASTRSVGAMAKIDERIEVLEAKLRQLKVQHQRKEARARSVAGKRARGAELRRKILVGAILLSKVETGEFDEAVLKRWMDAALSREEDRALFGLGAKS